MMSPERKPSRMPCLTQALTRQPVGAAASGSAARTLPADSAARSRSNAARARCRPPPSGCAASC